MSSSAEQEINLVTFNIDVMRQLVSDPPAAYPTINGHALMFDLSDPDEFFLQKAREELREIPEITAQSLKELKELLAGEPNLHVPNNNCFLTQFLRPCKWYADSAFKLMKRFYRFRHTYPHIFVNLLPSYTKIGFCSNMIYPLPLRNKDGSRVLLLEIGKRWKVKEVPPDYYFRNLLLLLDVGMIECKTQISGVHIILDAEGLSLHHVSNLTPNFAKMVLEFLQKCLPVRLKSIHVINQSLLFNVAFAIFKPFIEEKIRKRIFFHGTDRESLIAHLDKTLLFKKYGGELDPIDESYGTNLWHYMCKHENMYKIYHNFGYVKSDNKK